MMWLLAGSDMSDHLGPVKVYVDAKCNRHLYQQQKGENGGGYYFLLTKLNKPDRFSWPGNLLHNKKIRTSKICNMTKECAVCCLMCLCFTWGWLIKQTANGFNWSSGLWAVVSLVNTPTSSTVAAAVSLGSLGLVCSVWPRDTLSTKSWWATKRGATEEERRVNRSVCLLG